MSVDFVGGAFIAPVFTGLRITDTFPIPDPNSAAAPFSGMIVAGFPLPIGH